MGTGQPLKNMVNEGRNRASRSGYKEKSLGMSGKRVASSPSADQRSGFASGLVSSDVAALTTTGDRSQREEKQKFFRSF